MMIIFSDKMIKRFLFLAFIIFNLPGCVVDGTRTHSETLENINKDNIHSIFVYEKTTRRDVLVRLGPPDNSYDYMRSRTWVYHYRHEKNPLFLPRFSPLTGLDKTLTLSFDERGFLSNSKLIEKYAN